jgi:hypothetical protein
MNFKILLALVAGSLLLGCSQRMVDPAAEDELKFQVVSCDDAEEFFQGLEASSAKSTGYYACACRHAGSEDEVLITFSLPYAARFKVEIKGGTGYDLRTYDQMGVSGENVIHWDMKSKKGKTVGPGFYIVHLIAFMDEGQVKADMFMILE